MFIPFLFLEPSVVTLFAYVFIALVISFFCTLFKTVLVNISPGYLMELENNNDQCGGTTRKLYDDMDRPLAVLSAFKTLSLTLGATCAGILAAQWSGSPGIQLFGFVGLVVLMTLIAPRIIGALFFRSLIPVTTGCLDLLMTLSQPFVRVFDRLPYSEKHPIRLRDEMKAMADLGEESGVFHGDESDLVKNMLRFRDLKIVEIMTPRSVLFSLSEQITAGSYMAEYADSGFSRIPVFSGDDPDDINGFVMKNDILMACTREGVNTSLGELRRPLIAVMENESLPRLMSQFLEQRCHIAMVVTEYGDIRGIVTLEDIIETLLGREIVDESDEAVDMQQKARDKWAHRLPANA